MTEKQVKFCLKFKRMYEEARGQTYSKKDWAVVKDPNFNIDEAQKYLAPYFRNAVCDEYMITSDHSITVFVRNQSTMKDRFEDTREAMEWNLRQQQENEAKSREEDLAKEKALAAEVEADPLNEKWYGRGFASLYLRVCDHLSETTRQMMLAERDKREALASQGVA